MKLTWEQIQACTFGAQRLEWSEEAIRFVRFSPEQEAAFYAGDPVFLNSVNCTTGVRLDFHTDSASLTVETACAGKYEILIDSLPRFQWICEKSACKTFNLGDGSKRVTFVLPSHSEGRIRCIHIDPGATITPHVHSRKFLFFGDSITQGWESPWDCLSYAWHITNYFDADSYILGVGGTYALPDTVVPMNFNPELIFVAYGTNDLYRFSSEEAFVRSYSAYLRNLQTYFPDSKILCLTPIWRKDGNEAPIPIRSIRSLIEQEATKCHCVCIDGLSLVPHHPDYYSDGYLHPNGIGFSLYASNLIQAIQSCL